jgi:hypothetical protein
MMDSLGAPDTVAAALESLGGTDWRLSRSAMLFLSAHPDSIPRLHAIAQDESAARERRLWAVLALRYMDQDTSAVTERIPELRVPLSGPVPPTVRAAILHDIGVHEMEPGTDVRWMIEACDVGARYEAYYDYDALEARLPDLYAALEREGIRHGAAEDYGVVNGQHGLVSANFYVLPVDGAELRITLLGPFACTTAPVARMLETRLRRAAEGAGLLWLEKETLETELTGLVVEHYYERRVWRVGEYLYASADYRD